MHSKIDSDDSLEDRRWYADQKMPRMTASYAIVPLMLTTPLFTIARGTKGQLVDKTFHRPGVGYVRYAGPQLTQSHLTVLLGLARMFGGEQVGADSEQQFRPSTFLSSIGWSDKQENKLRLIELLDDLARGYLKIWSERFDEPEHYALRTHFVSRFKPSADRTVPWRVALDLTVLDIFSDKDAARTFLSVKERAQLREGLPTFLHGYIKANSCFRPFSVQELYAASGATGDVGQFREDVKTQLGKLQAAGIIESWRIEREGFRVFK